MNQETKKIIYLGAASFMAASLASVLSALGMAFIPMLLLSVSAGVNVLVSLSAKRAGNTKFHWLFPLAAFACALVLNPSGTFSISYGIVTLAAFAAGAVISAQIDREKSKVVAILSSDAVLFVMVLVAFFIGYFIEHKTLAPSAVVSSVKGFFDAIEADMAALFKETGIYTVASGILDLSGYTEDSFIKEIAGEIILTLKIISPSLIIFALNAFSYLATVFYTLSCRITKTPVTKSEGKWYLIPSAASAWILEISLVLYLVINLFSSFQASVAVETITSVLLNLIIILAPPMFICGVRGLIGRFRSKRPGFRFSAIAIIALAVGAAILIQGTGILYGLLFIALQGGWDMISFYRMKKLNERNKQNED